MHIIIIIMWRNNVTYLLEQNIFVTSMNTYILFDSLSSMLLLDFPFFWNDVFLKIPSWQVADMVGDNSILDFHVWEPLVIL